MNFKKLSLLICLPILFAFKQQGVFPSMVCTNLEQKSVTLPVHYAGKRSVLAVLVSLKADKAMQKWMKPLHQTLVEGIMGGMGANMYNANFGVVGVVDGWSKLALPELIKKSKQEVQPIYYPHIMYTSSSSQPLLQSLQITDKQVPHFFVLETDGTLLLHTSGEFTEAKLDEITSALLR